MEINSIVLFHSGNVRIIIILVQQIFIKLILCASQALF